MKIFPLFGQGLREVYVHVKKAYCRVKKLTPGLIVKIFARAFRTNPD